jgi:hypothetical protein
VSQPVSTEEFDYGIRLLIEYDEDAEGPDQWGDTEVFLSKVNTNRYRIGREKVSWVSSDDRDPDDELYQEYLDFPIRLIDYGSNGARLQFCSERRADGALLVKRRTDLEAIVSGVTSEQLAECVLEDWNTYLGGEVFCFIVQDSDGETLDGCCGFYGREAVEEEGRRSAQFYVEKAQAEVRGVG